MIKWYLVLYMVIEGGSITTIPTPYNDKIQCEEAAKDWDDSFKCIQAKVDIDKGYVCQPGASVCQVVK